MCLTLPRKQVSCVIFYTGCQHDLEDLNIPPFQSGRVLQVSLGSEVGTCVKNSYLSWIMDSSLRPITLSWCSVEAKMFGSRSKGEGCEQQRTGEGNEPQYSLNKVSASPQGTLELDGWSFRVSVHQRDGASHWMLSLARCYFLKAIPGIGMPLDESVLLMRGQFRGHGKCE